MIFPFPADSVAWVPSRSWLSDTNSSSAVPGRGQVNSAEEIMNILEAYDLMGSLRDAAELRHPLIGIEQVVIDYVGEPVAVQLQGAGELLGGIRPAWGQLQQVG